MLKRAYRLGPYCIPFEGAQWPQRLKSICFRPVRSGCSLLMGGVKGVIGIGSQFDRPDLMRRMRRVGAVAATVQVTADEFPAIFAPS